MTTERKYRKPLNRNGWMRKIQQACFGASTPSFVGYCPFFWFTWLCLIISPIALTVRGIGRLFESLDKGTKIVVNAVTPIKKVRRPHNIELLAFYEEVLVRSFEAVKANCYPFYFESVWPWIEVTPDWENCAKRLLVQAQRSEMRATARAKQVAKFSNYATPIVKTILLVLAFCVGIKALIFIWGALAAFRWSILWGFLVALVGALPYALAGCLAIFLLSLFVTYLVERRRKCPKCPDKVSFLSKIGIGIVAGIEFVAETIESIYTRECPLIEWADESEPIQRR